MRQLLSNKKFLSIYAIWILIHTILYLSSDKYHSSSFWPFTEDSVDNSYDETEWISYVFGPILLIFLYVAFNTEDESGEKNIKV